MISDWHPARNLHLYYREGLDAAAHFPALMSDKCGELDGPGRRSAVTGRLSAASVSRRILATLAAKWLNAENITSKRLFVPDGERFTKSVQHQSHDEEDCFESVSNKECLSLLTVFTQDNEPHRTDRQRECKYECSLRVCYIENTSIKSWELILYVGAKSVGTTPSHKSEHLTTCVSYIK